MTMSNPSCRWCRGTGQIPLAFRVVPCECVTAESPRPPTFERDDDGYGATQTYYHGPLGEAWLTWGRDCRNDAPLAQHRWGLVGEVFRPRPHSGTVVQPGKTEPPVTGFGFPAVGGRHPHEQGLALSATRFWLTPEGVLLLGVMWTPLGRLRRPGWRGRR